MKKYITVLALAMALAGPALANNTKVLCKTFDGTEFVHFGSFCPAGTVFVRYVF